MSELWSVEVLNRGQKWVDLVVTQVHPDAGPMPESKGFALGLLLCEAYDRESPAPIAERIAFDDSYDVVVQEKRADEFVEAVRIYHLVNAPFDEKEAHAATDAIVVSRGIAKDSPEWDDAWSSAWNEWWASPNGPPRATYRITVKDPRWVAHLEPGKSFDSAGYSESGPWANENRDDKSPLPGDAVVKAHQLAFPLSHVPRGDRDMNPELVRQLAGTEAPLAGKALEDALALHLAFLESGGRDGEWQLVSAAGMPICLYTGAEGESGEQLVLRSKTVARGAALEAKDVAFADLSGSVCEGVSFQNAKLDGSVAVDAFFDGASFANASLRHVDFSGSSLKGCSFTNADLRDADFEHTDCTGADFTGAKLRGSRFPGAILKGVKR